MKILLIGACGRMGSEIGALAARRGETVIKIDRADPSLADMGASPHADVAIDVSSEEGLVGRLELAKARRLPYLLGVTGLKAECFRAMAEVAREIPLLYAENFSLAVQLLACFAEYAARVLDFDVEIIERHHANKRDAPSGTALALLRSVEAGRGALFRVYGRHGASACRRREEIGIHAVRGGTTPGCHEVGFYGAGEVLTLAHRTESREALASGALHAAAWLLTRPAGLYSMKDLLPH